MSIINGKPGEEYLLLGNEGVVRGALEAGVDVATQYPGTPSSEIGDTFWRIKDSFDFYYEYSTNEKVALEIAAAAAASGLRSLTAMKHVGLNVAADSFMSTVYTGVRGGMVIVVADDPSMHSSQNEQDTRIYARLAGIPLLEPSTPGEAKEFTVKGFEISEELGLPVILRLTTRISHTRGPVKFGPLQENRGKSKFEFDPPKFVPIPANARKGHIRLRTILEQAENMAVKTDLNRIFEGKEPVGVIASSIGSAYARELWERLDGRFWLLTLGFSFPMPANLIKKFSANVEKLLIVEELEPVLEDEIRSLLYDNDKRIEIFGKHTDTFSRIYEYTPLQVENALFEILGLKEDRHNNQTQPEEKLDDKEIVNLPPRPPVLCSGCPHRHSYYSFTKAIKGMDKPICASDIGCYTLGYGTPFNAADYLLSMGASIGSACGFARATEQTVVAFIGDSTFLHGGIPGLIDAVNHNHNLTLIILDNDTTGMTGHQPNPSASSNTNMGLNQVLLEDVVKGLGVKFVEVVDPGDIENTTNRIKKAIEFEGPSVIISRAPCILMKNRERLVEKFVIPKYQIDEEKCKNCKICLNDYSCPAFYLKDGQVAIDTSLCNGCGVCSQVCPFDAIKEVEKI